MKSDSAKKPTRAHVFGGATRHLDRISQVLGEYGITVVKHTHVERMRSGTFDCRADCAVIITSVVKHTYLDKFLLTVPGDCRVLKIDHTAAKARQYLNTQGLSPKEATMKKQGDNYGPNAMYYHEVDRILNDNPILILKRNTDALCDVAKGVLRTASRQHVVAMRDQIIKDGSNTIASQKKRRALAKAIFKDQPGTSVSACREQIVEVYGMGVANRKMCEIKRMVAETRAPALPTFDAPVSGSPPLPQNAPYEVLAQYAASWPETEVDRPAPAVERTAPTVKSINGLEDLLEVFDKAIVVRNALRAADVVDATLSMNFSWSIEVGGVLMHSAAYVVSDSETDD